MLILKVLLNGLELYMLGLALKITQNKMNWSKPKLN